MLNGEATRTGKKIDMSLPLLLHDYYVKLPSYMFYGGNFVCAYKKFICLCSCPLFFHCR